MIAQFTVRGLTIGTLDSNLCGYLIYRSSGFDFPITRVSVSDNGNYHGANLNRALYGRRVMSLEGEIIASSPTHYEQLRRAMQEAFNLAFGLQRATIVTTGGESVRAEVILNNKIEQPYQKGMRIRGEYRLEITAPFPYFLADTEQSTDVFMFTGGGGAIPMAIPFAMATGLSGNVVITNDGNVDAYPRITIYGALDTPTITNATTGKQISIDHDLDTDDYVELDFFKRTALLNGTTNIFDEISGDWWLLQHGDNTIKLTGISYSGNARAVVFHQDHYLGL
jgi:hypothetical protein